MLYPVTLTTQLSTTTPEGESDRIDHTTRAMAALRDNGTWSIRYADPDNHGQTLIQGADSWCSISREGDTQSRLLFRLDEMLDARYETPQGEFAMATRATQYAAQVDANGGSLLLDYDLFLSGDLVAHNHLLVQWQRL